MIKENILIQKYRMKWLNDGDVNNKFFHSIMKNTRRRNYIGSINYNRGLVNSVVKVKEQFEKKYFEVHRSRPKLEEFLFKMFSLKDQSSLEASFSKKEIKEAVWNSEESKSPDAVGLSESPSARIS